MFACIKLWISRQILHLELKFLIFLNTPMNGLFKITNNLFPRPKGSREIGKKRSGNSFLRLPVHYYFCKSFDQLFTVSQPLFSNNEIMAWKTQSLQNEIILYALHCSAVLLALELCHIIITASCVQRNRGGNSSEEAHRTLWINL